MTNPFLSVQVVSLVVGTVLVLGLSKYLSQSEFKLRSTLEPGSGEENFDNENNISNSNYEDELDILDLEDDNSTNSLTFKSIQVELSSKLMLNPIGLDLTGGGQFGNSESEKTLINSIDGESLELELTYRLPKSLIPFEYNLVIMPVLPAILESTKLSVLSENSTETNGTQTSNASSLELFTAIGQVIISFDCVQSTNRIVMHEVNISIDESSVKVFAKSLNDEKNVKGNESISDIPVIGHEYDKVQQFYTILLGKNLEAGKKYKVLIKFTSHITVHGNSIGIFATTHRDPATDQVKWMVATKFQATHARKAFPCFDEPELKSVFHITVGYRSGYHALSNAEHKETLEDPQLEGWFWDVFEPTRKMSTYLVCFAVSDFTSEEADRNLTNGKSIRVWAPKHLIDKGGGVYAVDLTAKIVAYFEDYFNMTDVPKVDSIMVPFFTTSAMENWGLITYMEHMLIYIAKENSQYRRSLVTTVVAHELSHHYFGNLVTCKFWEDLWLNEGFATYLSFLVMANLHPEFEPENEFVNDIIQLSMRTDPSPSTQPIRVFAKSPTEIDGAFSRTTYRKGGSIIRMMKYFLGEGVLQEGMRRFLSNHSYSSAIQDDLFREFDQAGRHVLPDDVSVKKIMDTWTLQSGFPLVRVDVLGPKSIKLSQEKISWSPMERNTDPDIFWWIPIAVVTADKPSHSSTTPNTWMPDNTSHLQYTESHVDTNKWIVVNPDYAGYFSVLYDAHLTQLLKEQLERDHTVLSPITRSQILFDYINFWNAKYVSFEAALNMTKYIGGETEFVVWNTAFPFFSELNRRLLASPQYHELYLKYLLPKLESVWLSPAVGLEVKPNEKPTALFFRTEIMNMACQLDSQICLDYAKTLYNKWKNNVTINPFPELQEEMLACSMVKALGEEAWEFIFAKYQVLTTQYQKWVLFKALTCSTTPDLISRTLDVIGNSSLHTWQSLPSQGLVNLASNKHAIKVLYSYILENYEANSTLSYLTPETVTSTITSLSYYLYEEADIRTLKDFVQENRLSLFKELKTLINAVSVMEENQTWMNVYGSVLFNWLKANS